jgi:translation initiation factor 5
MSKINQINIQGLKDIKDPLYRYKMNKVIVTKLKTTTELTNLHDICTNDLKRDPKQVLDYFKKKFGINFTLKDKRIIATREFTQEEITTALREFIEYFILCPVCRLPETEYDKLLIKCKCCSYHGVTIKR